MMMMTKNIMALVMMIVTLATRVMVMVMIMVMMMMITMVMMFATLATRVPALCLQSLRPEREKYLKRRTCETSIIF